MLLGCQSHQLSTTGHSASEQASFAFRSSKLPSVEKHHRGICIILTCLRCPDAELLATKLLNNINRNKPVGFYGPNAPPVLNATSSECPWASITARRRAAGSIRIPAERPAAAAVPLPESPHGQQTSKSISSVSLVRIESTFFTIHSRHRRKKWWNRILKFEFCDFWEFFEIFKKASRCPSSPNWTIMVAVKLDHSN